MTIGSKAEKLLSPGTLMMKKKDKSLSVEDKVEGLDSERKQVDFGTIFLLVSVFYLVHLLNRFYLASLLLLQNYIPSCNL